MSRDYGGSEVKAFREAIRKEIEQQEREKAEIAAENSGRGTKKRGWGTTLVGAFSEATNPYHHDMPWKYRQR